MWGAAEGRKDGRTGGRKDGKTEGRKDANGERGDGGRRGEIECVLNAQLL